MKISSILLPATTERLKYEVRNKIISQKGVNHRDATDRVSEFRATGKLHAMSVKNFLE